MRAEGGQSGVAHYSISADGTLVYVTSRAAQRTLVWVDREGREDPLNVPPGSYQIPRVSPDGTRVAVVADQAGSEDVWIYDRARATLERLTDDSGLERDEAWSPDATWIAYHASGREGGPGIFRRRADGTGAVERLTTGDHRPLSWSLDGERLFYIDLGRESTPTLDIGIVEVSGGRGGQPLLASPTANEVMARPSPSGQWLAYVTDETGETEVFVRPFPDVDGARTRISSGGGLDPVWAPGGEAIYYRQAQAIMEVMVSAEAPSSWGAPRELFRAPYLTGGLSTPTQFDIDVDGLRFLMVRDVDSSVVPAGDVVVVQNFFTELERLVPTQ